MPFFIKCLRSGIARLVSDAKIEVESFVVGIATKLGFEMIKEKFGNNQLLGSGDKIKKIN